MDFTVVEVSDLNLWNTAVQSAAEYTFLQSWQFGELQKNLGYEVKRFGIGSEHGDLLCVFQTVVIKARRGKILQLRHAPVLLPGFFMLEVTSQTEVLSMFLNEIEEQARSAKCDFIRLQSLVKLESLPEYFKLIAERGFLKSNMHNIDAEKTLILNITPEDVELLANMRKQTRYSINKAAKMGVSISRETGPAAIEKFYRIHHETTLRQKFKSFSLDYYQKFFEFINLEPESGLKSEVFLANFEGKDIAGAIIIYMGKKAFYSDGGSLTAYAKIPASYAVQWAAIQRAKQIGCETYNFWGGISPDKENKNYPWYGIDLFKRGFGGDRVEYMHAADLPLTGKYYLTRIWEYYEKFKRGY